MTNWAQMNPIFIIAAVLWTLVWKGLALWRSAELRQKYWFIALLIVNSLGILEIIYLFLVAKNYRVEVIEENK
ncbi:MAG: hypothetical protein A3A31_03210 [Candidatus Zambryskibacteria bacterium RIFCSPLOWO2_01_FULL_48_25]|uniref:DUF5652 domain-containing protein n=1 Tax=Candidatus Zambryskibacteria bacterium RIFCSPHIGHO2_01_FULL_46_25 TaxID=1802738 RepID=A0A1G2SYA9_9BACT|nr:MAG: hypothetical protein A2838_00050 [Candidatus Zambryskibacteria bacterium RIFCSPHIGHO2_01_FULL_46_25]OHB06617.1 MAG: hypothetical protein A3A31_03210 [Candidatus Zambryskibacteria bacterium RIFCSPLOWO2_01_FULL_48_25]